MAKKSAHDRRAEILDAAQRVLATEGVFAFTARKVALELKIPSSSVFYHFPSHRDLFVGVQESIMGQAESIVQELTTELHRTNPNASLLEGYVRGTLLWARQYPVHVKILISAFFLATDEFDLHQQHLTTTARGVDKIYHFLAIAVAENHLSTNLPLKQTSELIHSALTGACLKLNFDPIRGELEFQYFSESFWQMVRSHLQHSEAPL